MNGAVSRIPRWLRRDPWIELLALLVVAVIIDAKLLLNTDQCVNWGNYVLPCTREQYSTIWPLQSAWLQYTYLGAPVALPLPNVLNQITGLYPLAILSTIVGPPQGAAWYAVLSVFLLGASFLLLTRTLLQVRVARFAATILLIVGPFSLPLYGNGDFPLFVAQAFVFVSLYLLWRAVREPSRRWAFYPASLIALLLSLADISIFELGLFLYASFLLGFILLEQGRPVRQRLAAVGKLSVRFLVLPFALAPLLLPAILSPSLSLAPNSAYANSLDTFRTLSETPLALFFLFGYTWAPGGTVAQSTAYVMTSSVAGGFITEIWIAVVVALVLSIWVGVLLFRDRRGIFLLALALAASLLGSGVYGPLGPFNSYLYLHLTGYQELNASYYWDWTIVAPVTALALGLFVERLICRARIEGARGSHHVSTQETVPGKTVGARARLRRVGRSITARRSSVLITALVTTTVILPYVWGAQNGPVEGQSVGIQTSAYPGSYSQLPGLVKQLAGPTDAAIAVFSPTAQWILNGSSTLLENYFIAYPTARVPTIPSYVRLPYPSNYYVYWAYDELYSNSSKYVGELLALAGIGYLVVFYGTQVSPPYELSSPGYRNVSSLLKFQVGIEPITATRTFATYKDLYFSGSAIALANLSVVSDGYSELDALSYAGVNLTNQGLLFSTDLSPRSCGGYLDQVSQIFAASPNGLTGLAIQCAASYSVDPSGLLPGGNTIDSGWPSSYSYTSGALGQTSVESWPTALAVTRDRGSSINIPIEAGGCRACSLWVPVRIASNGGALGFTLGALTWTLRSGIAWGGWNNSMVWVQLPFHPVSGSGTMKVTSISGWNAIGDVFAASPTAVTEWITNLTTSKPILMAMPGVEMAPPTQTQPGQQWNYCGLHTVDSFEQSSICFQTIPTSPIGFNLSLPDSQPGWLSLLVRASSDAVIQVGDHYNQTIGFDTQNGNWSQYPMGWIRIPIDPSQITSNDTLPFRLMSGAVAISEFVYAPKSAYPAFEPAPVAPVLTQSSTTLSSSVSGFNFSLGNETGGVQSMSGTIQYSSQQYHQWLGTVGMNRSVTTPYDTAVTYSISPGIVANLDGVEMSGSGELGPAQLTRSLDTIPLSPNWATSNLAFYSTDTGSVTSENASYSIQVRYGTLPLNSTLSNIDPRTSWNVTPTSTGYELSGGPASMVLVRVPFYPNLQLTPSDAQLVPALGSVDSLILGTVNHTHFAVVTKAAAALVLGLEIMGGTFAVWMAAEFFWYRYQSKRRRATPREHSQSNAAKIAPAAIETNGKAPPSLVPSKTRETEADAQSPGDSPGS